MQPPPADLRIVDFAPRWRADFARLNLEWLQRWFVVEAVDEAVLQDPETHLLAGGGRVLFALRGTGAAQHAVGTAALRHDGDGVYELTKMAVAPDQRGTGIGRALLQASLDVYSQLGGRELYLESSSILKPALLLYASAGFVHHPAPRPGSHYARADVHMIWEPGR